MYLIKDLANTSKSSIMTTAVDNYKFSQKRQLVQAALQGETHLKIKLEKENLLVRLLVSGSLLIGLLTRLGLGLLKIGTELTLRCWLNLQEGLRVGVRQGCSMVKTIVHLESCNTKRIFPEMTRGWSFTHFILMTLGRGLQHWGMPSLPGGSSQLPLLDISDLWGGVNTA